VSAAATLRPLLSTDWKPATEVEEEAEALGLTHDQIRGAREWLGITRVNGAVGFRDGRWHWRLPPDGCVTCHRPWEPAGFRGGDYWAGRPSPPTSREEEDGIPVLAEPPAPLSPPSQPAWAEPYGPPVCSVCGKASAMEPGGPCPYSRPDGQRCVGTVE
jgi:hypothetical protein